MRRANSLEKTLILGKDKRRRGQKTRLVRQNYRFNGPEFEQTPGDSEGQGSLVYCCPWGHKELDVTSQLNNHHK